MLRQVRDINREQRKCRRPKQQLITMQLGFPEKGRTIKGLDV